MVKDFDGGSALIEQWLKNKDTVLFLGIWEQLNSLVFNSLDFEGIKNEAGRNSLSLSVFRSVVHRNFIRQVRPVSHRPRLKRKPIEKESLPKIPQDKGHAIFCRFNCFY